MNTRRRRTSETPAPSATGDAERVILVDEEDRELGSEEKLRAHEAGALHRAVSVFLFDDQGRLLLQQRAEGKYHSAGLWSNTCCGHPRPGESAADAAARRLREEMGIACDLTPRFVFRYRAGLDGGLTEHELDHVFTGRFTGTPSPDPREVEAWGWMSLPALAADCETSPHRYSAWLPIAVREILARGLDPT
ncbi:MAG TPA: isopentenyl-diphosphate Delta-isomerase [Gemmatimonadaceae bacterium]|nr:isopentenyl-diphosphate Delta-isomerase [Gemmatimonadaceae bacterium]